MSAAMSSHNVRQLLNYISRNHNFGWGKGKGVKYVRPSFDMRTGECFHVRLEGMFKPVDFAIINEWRDHPDSLHKRILDWLNDEKSAEALSYENANEERPLPEMLDPEK